MRTLPQANYKVMGFDEVCERCFASEIYVGLEYMQALREWDRREGFDRVERCERCLHAELVLVMIETAEKFSEGALVHVCGGG